MRAPPGREIGLLHGAWIIFSKDVLIEWRTRARANALAFFSIATLLLFSFAVGPDIEALRAHAGGYLWLGILFASVLALGESFRVESENGALTGVRLAPTDARAVFIGKALGNTVMLIGLSVLLLPVMVALFDVGFSMGVLPLAGVVCLGCMAIAAPGTVYAAIAANARARDVLLPLLLFPLLIPALLAVVKATTLLIEGDAQTQLPDWLALLMAFNLVYWSLGLALFPKVIED